MMRSNIYPNTRERWILVLILLFAFLLRMWDLGRNSLWYDEILQVQIAGGAPENFLPGLELNAAMPLDYVVERGVLTLGTNELLLRFMAAAASTLAVVVLYKLGRAMFGELMGLVAAAFLAVASLAVLYAHEARPYSFYMLFALASFYWMYRALKTNRLTHWLYFGVCIAGAVLSHLFALFVVMTQGLFLFGGLVLRAVAPRRAQLFARITRTAILGGVVVAALFLAALWLTPNAQYVWGSALRFFSFLLSPQFLSPDQWSGLAPGETAPVLSFDFLYSHVFENFSGGGVVPTGAFFGLGLIGLTAFPRKPWEIFILALWAIVPSALIILFLGSRGTLFAIRYLIASLPPWILLCAVGAEQLGALVPLGLRPSRILVVLLIAFVFIGISLDRTNVAIAAPKEDWRTAGALLDANVKPDDAVLTPGGTQVVSFYAQSAATNGNSAQVVAQIADAENHSARVWSVMNRYVYDPGGEIQAWLDGRGALALRVDDGITVYYWRKGADTNALLADTKAFRLPASSFVYTSLAQQYALTGNGQEAQQNFAKALSFSKNQTEAALVNAAWGETLRQAGDDDGAAEKYRAALASDAEQLTAWVGLGRVYLDQNQLPAAKDALTRALALEPDSYAALFFLATYYERNGQSDVAHTYYARAAQIIPDLTTPP